MESRLFTALKKISAKKAVFRLSELLPQIDDSYLDLSMEEVLVDLTPHLASLELKASISEDDIFFTHTGQTPDIVTARHEDTRQTAFFDARRIPAAIERSIEDYITRKASKNWNDTETLGRLKKAIVAQKDDYWRPAFQRRLKYAKGYSVLGYLAYHFPVYFMQAEHLLAMIARDGLLKPSMNILDVGTGPGVVPLAIADFYSRLEDRKATVHSLERSEEHIEAFMFLRERCTTKGANVSVKAPILMDIMSPDLGKVPGKIDLMIFSNVLNELPGDSPNTGAEIVAKLAERLSPDGTILITEPADEENATRMRSLTIALVRSGFTIYGPCSFLWGTRCEAPRCWSFASARPILPTHIMDVLRQDKEGFRYVNTDIKYSYVILRKDGRTKQDCRLPADAKYLRLSKISQHVGKRINVAAAKMSGELGNAKSHVIKVCDGTAKAPVYAVMPEYHHTEKNEMIIKAPYGSILELKGVLVRFNKTHNAYNLLVSRNTIVDGLEAGENK